MSTPIRVCLVGAGRVAKVHASSLVHHVPAGKLVGIADTDPYVLEETADQFGVDDRFRRLEEALGNADFDAVVITTPTFTHASLVANFKGAARGVDSENFYDNVLVNIRFESGGLGSISGVCPCEYGYDARVEIVGERGIMQIGEMKGQSVVVCTNRDQGLVTPIYRTWPERFAWGYIREMEHFIDCIQTDTAPRVGGEDARWAVAGVLAGTKSFLEERPVYLREVLGGGEA